MRAIHNGLIQQTNYHKNRNNVTFATKSEGTQWTFCEYPQLEEKPIFTLPPRIAKS